MTFTRAIQWWKRRRIKAMEQRYSELHGILLTTQKEMAELGNELSRYRGLFRDARGR